MNSRKILKAAVNGKYFSENLLLQANALWKFGETRLTPTSKPGKLDRR
jgi:hypothetical protein